MPRLFTLEGEMAYEFREETVTIGRGDYNAFPLRKRGVSKLHAKIEHTEEGYLLSDEGSTNGTFVNGRRVTEFLLADGDEIRLGHYRLIFRLEAAEIAPVPRDEDQEAYTEAVSAEEAEEEYEEVGPEPEDKEREEEEVSPEEEVAPELSRMELQGGDRRRRARLVVATIVCLLASLIVHVQLMYLARNVRIGAIRPSLRPLTRLEMDFVVLMPREKPPPDVVIELREITPEEQEIAKEELPKVEKDVRPMPVESVSLASIASLLPIGDGGGSSQVFHPEVASQDVYRIVVPEKPKRFQDVMDDFALEMLHALEKDRLLVVLIFDESLSLEPDRHYMYKRLDRVIEILNLHLGPVELARLKWGVMSFGKFPRIWQNATDDISLVRDAIMKVPVDTSGVENLITALQYASKCFKPSRGQMFLVVVTDETGDDTSDDKLVEDTVKMLSRRRARVFFFGREANFSYPIVERAYRDPKGGPTVMVPVNAGPESAFSEFFSPDELFNRISELPSGFGMYVQSRLAAATGGKFYLLVAKGSSYDEEKLGEYGPELCSREDYLKLRQGSKLRQTLWQTIQGWDQLRPDGRGQNTFNAKRTVEEGISKAKKTLDYCEECIQTLKRYRERARTEKSCPQRWEANSDLVYAQVLKLQYMLLEYIGALKRLGDNLQPMLNGAPFIGFVVVPALDREAQSKEGAEAIRKATAAFQSVIAKHDGTPWAAMARKQMNSMHSFRAVPRYRIERRPTGDERDRPPRPPEPPKPPAI